MALDVADRGYVLETGRDRARGRREGAAPERAGPQDLPRRGVAQAAADPVAGSRAARAGSRSGGCPPPSPRPSPARPGRRASARTRAAARRPRRGSRRRAPRRAGRGRAGTRPSRRRAGAGGTCGPARYASIARGSAATLRSASASSCGSRPVRVAWKKARYGCWVGWAKRRRSGLTRIAVPPSRTGNASRQRRRARPRPSVAAISAFGRSRGRSGVVRGIPMQIASSGSSSAADPVSTLRTSASACATEGGPANAAEAVSSNGSADSVAPAQRRGRGRTLAPGGAGDPARRLLRLVGVAAQRPGESRQVEGQRRADQRDPRADRALEGERELPAGREVRLEQRLGGRLALGPSAPRPRAARPGRRAARSRLPLTTTTTSASRARG